MLAICAYYTGIMLNTFAAYYANNYAGIIGSSLTVCQNFPPLNVWYHISRYIDSDFNAPN